MRPYAPPASHDDALKRRVAALERAQAQNAADAGRLVRGFREATLEAEVEA
jgi:hypothetical protein